MLLKMGLQLCHLGKEALLAEDAVDEGNERWAGAEGLTEGVTEQSMFILLPELLRKSGGDTVDESGVGSAESVDGLLRVTYPDAALCQW